MQFDRGYISHFVTNSEKMEAELENPFILIYDKRSSNMKDILHIPRKKWPERSSAADHRRPRKGTGYHGGEQAPRHAESGCGESSGFGDRRREMLQDIAVLTKGYRDPAKNRAYKLENADLATSAWLLRLPSTKTIRPSWAVRAEKISQPHQPDQKRRSVTTSVRRKEKLQERLAKLSGG